MDAVARTLEDRHAIRKDLMVVVARVMGKVLIAKAWLLHSLTKSWLNRYCGSTVTQYVTIRTLTRHFVDRIIVVLRPMDVRMAAPQPQLSLQQSHRLKSPYWEVQQGPHLLVV